MQPAHITPVTPDYEVGVIGAGFAGLVAGLKLLAAGRTSLAVFERAADVGGVWRDNVYPGCACDIRSHLYSIASHPNPDWRATYAAQSEILAYLRRTAESSGLIRHIRFNAEIVEARFVEAAACWRLTDATGGVHHVRVLVLASGPLNRPAIPGIEGAETFAGTSRHSSAWDATLNLQGKSVAVIGTAASAVQIVPNLAGAVGRLTVFQRSAPWVLPRGGRNTTRFERWLHRRIPLLQALKRSAIYWAMEAMGTAFFGNGLVHRLLVAVALRKLRREVADPKTRRRLTPDYALGCKRMTVSDDFYPAFNRDDVSLVTEPIAALTAKGVRTRDGAVHEVDHIVYATGFIVADADDFLKVVGADGRELAVEWARTGAQAYRGVTVSGYPNLFLLLGPNSGLSYASVVHVAESQADYLLGYLDALDRAGAVASLDVRTDTQAGYNDELQARLTRSIWASGCQSWYLNRNGRNTAIYPGLSSRYRRLMRRFDPDAYQVKLEGASTI